MRKDPMIRLAGLKDDAVRHAFFTRQGGVSRGHYASLNCGWGSGDTPADVDRNRAIAMQRLDLDADRLATCRQVHGTAAITVAEPWPRESAPRADALATNVPGIALGVLAADCAPILLCDPAAHVIGAAHAGWRGALGGVAEAAVTAMEQLGATRSRIRAAIGPCIGRASYEVGPEFPQPFIAPDAAAAMFFTAAPRTGHFLFDLAGYVEYRLAGFGVAQIERAGCDTVADPERFFSYRRARLRGEPAFGLLLSAIVLAG
jgi:YfiH family protein